MRLPVLAPGEIPAPEKYIPRKGVESRVPMNHTAFRIAERRYKGRKTPIDFSQVIDPRKGHELLEKMEYKVSKEYKWKDFGNRAFGAWSVKGMPGFIVIPEALNEQEQKELAKKCYTSYIEPPNLNSLDRIFSIPSKGLWKSMVENTPIYEYEKSENESSGYDTDVPYATQYKNDKRKKKETPVVDVENAIRRLRWIILGYPYNWYTKEYDFNSTFKAVPLELNLICKTLSEMLGFGPYEAEAGIVNFYQEKDTLMGHVDRSEKNMNAPLFSISLGQSAIFLIGGKTREDPVIPILLRSGDIAILSGESRWFYHGVPRIIENSLPEYFMDCCDCGNEENHSFDCWKLVSHYLKGTRLNINIRQVN
ncbi:hypothetical protein ROZALSC1DRAFT_28308 [Rozella allomycis CSF55]|uniref:Alpha-ketoglutarate-dependent dioxygenase AlkB-like domain-containing protein n=1 Tax=Rozella allomycis (strain CSF55) TaxID=988480 RepID=A0A075ANE4_ROZAC|nr:Alpha-ketoglutarate-dependent dioxygenase AlkB-like domain-containing protein [Rozella allomycis CSF55]RKP20191.1 hypothetical protein ROZALSC1DRAFT_28308 [Rozella allomycis CSF55]|eukprot:EPZ31319.1 Alpha-ketoglutarate-dependent dioxygenase AlkB-like domain-containing protein [Rozella allomycis CSF55]